MKLPGKFKDTQVIDSGVENGIDWFTYEAPLYGAVNGYARVPEDHPWSGLDYDDIEDVDVSGGLTYAHDGWIGFDTLHFGDYWPGMPDFHGGAGVIHWTADMVADETRALARQVARAAVSS